MRGVTRRHRLRAEDFARRLTDTRERQGLTQDALAARVGYETRQAISELERATIGVTITRCAEIAAVLGVSAVWLAYGIEGGAPATGREAEGYGGRLREARVARGLSQRALSAALGYAGNSAVAKLEQEARGLEIGQAERIAQALQVSPEWLAYGVSPPA